MPNKIKCFLGFHSWVYFPHGRDRICADCYKHEKGSYDNIVKNNT